MKLQVVVVLVVFACHLEHTSAVSCTATTASMCKKSMYVTGTCTASVCGCTTNSKAGKYGCQKLDKPKVTATSNGISSSGEFITDGQIKLTCDVAGEGDVTYKWFKDDKKMVATTKDITIAKLALANAGKYKCSFQANEAESIMSDEFTLTLVADATDAANFKIKPVLNGLPKKAFDGQVLKLTCEVSPADKASSWTFKFNVDGTKLAATLANAYDYAFDETKKVLSCIAIKGAVELESEKIANPQKLTDVPKVKITGPSMQVLAKPATLTCAIDDEDVSENEVTWSWKKDGKTLTSKTNKEYEITSVTAAGDDGTYTCEAKFKTMNKESGKFIVKGATVTHTVSANPANALVAGYIAMTCSVEGAKSDADITYSWKKGSNVLYGVDDNVLQLNTLASGDEGGYTCNPKVGGVDLGDSSPSVFDATPVDLTAAITPTISSSKKSGNYEVGKTYTLTCTSDYISPGVTFIWTKASTIVSGENGKTLKIKAETTKASYTCKLSFNKKMSSASVGMDVEGKSLVEVNIYNFGAKTGTISLLKGTTVELECKATLAAGVKDKVTYAWIKDKVSTVVKTAKYPITADTSFKLQCEATVGSEKLKSEEIDILISANIAQPTIIVDPQVDEQSKGASYTLKCMTISAAKEITYEFKRGTTIVGDKTMQYTIKSASASDSGEYTCTAMFGNKKSTESSKYTITVGDPGKYCTVNTVANDCKGTGYVATCNSKKRCECAKKFVAKKDTCQSGASVVVASLIGTVLAIFMTRLF